MDGSPVVAEEKDEGVLLLTALAERIEGCADGIIHQADLSGVFATERVFDRRKLRETFGGGFVRKVGRIEGEVEEPGVFGVTFYKSSSFFSECGGEVAFDRFVFTVPLDGDGVFTLHIGFPVDEFVPAADEAVGLGEAPVFRTEVGCGSEVPFPDPSGFVAGFSQEFGEEFFGNGKTFDGIRGVVVGIVFVTKAVLVSTGHEAGASGTAEGMGDVSIGADEPFPGESVKMGSGDVLATMESDVGIAMVI